MKYTTKDIGQWVGVIALGACLGVASACSGKTTSSSGQSSASSDDKKEEIAEQTIAVSQQGTDIKLVSSKDWADKYPNEYQTYLLNDENKDIVEYTEQDEYIQTLYAGIGFAKHYSSARGHTYVVEDVTNTGRPHALSNCYTCKTSEFTVEALNTSGEAYKTPFEEFNYSGTDAFGCFHCHENEPSGTKLYITHSYVADALGDDINNIDPATLTCAQCHTEYYFDPETKATSVAYHGLAQMGPDAELEHQNNLKDAEGNLFADFVDEATGTRKLKAQHPEFETYVSAGSTHYAMKLSCADCHMEKQTADDGTAFTSHNWVSPLKSETILNDTCAKCHSDTAAITKAVLDIEDATMKTEREYGEKLVQLEKDLTEAVANNTLSEEDLEKVRMAYRNAQWYWDYVYVENSEGFHNTKLTADCFAKCQTYLDEANAVLGK